MPKFHSNHCLEANWCTCSSTSGTEIAHNDSWPKFCDVPKKIKDLKNSNFNDQILHGIYKPLWSSIGFKVQSHFNEENTFGCSRLKGIWVLIIWFLPYGFLPQGNYGLVLWFVHIVQHIAQLHSPLYNAFYFTNHWIIFPLLNIFTTPFQKGDFQLNTNLFHWMLKNHIPNNV
jgi:hypothetical protein